MANPETRELLKLAARRLFARRGYDGVTVRDIVLAAGQRNSGSLHYYFGTKEDLARELIVDGAKLINDRRNHLLDDLEQSGRKATLRELVEILIWPSTDLGESDGTTARHAGEDTYISFITAMQISHRSLFMSALEGKWATGYTRCLEHIRAILTPKIDAELVNQRLLFMSLYLRATLSSREEALSTSRRHRFWSADVTMQNLIDTVIGILQPPPSPQTRAALSRQAAKPTVPRRKKENVSNAV